MRHLVRMPGLGRCVAAALSISLGLAIAVGGLPTGHAAATLASHVRANPHAMPLVRSRPGWTPAAGTRRVCPVPTEPGQMECFSLLRSTGHGSASPDLRIPGAYNPADLRSAYNLAAAAASRGSGETVAVVDAYNDPNAAADLAAYRGQWHLPACDQATGDGCVTVVNQHGTTSPLPGTDFTGSWELEESIDLDMVSAICPACHIVLVEAASPALPDLAAAEDAAVALGAKFVSDSWGGGDSVIPSPYDRYFDHPGVAITVAAGDLGYGPSYPATSQFVTSVGGTTLLPASNTARGWTESAWAGTGSGCSFGQPKPAWQTMDDTSPRGCLNRTGDDVAAVADPNTGVWAYDSYPIGNAPPDWQPVGGTSVAAPIIAAVYALAGQPEPGTYPASYLYQHGNAARLFDVTGGSNGICEPDRAYLCHGEPGYDGPTGWGTPDGTAAFASAAAGHTVTVADPGVRDVGAGTALTVPISAVDSAGARLSYAAHGLPAGMSINPATGLIAGRVSTAATSTVTVTATDASGASGSVSFRIVVVPSMRAAYHPVTGPVRLTLSNAVKCLEAAGDGTRNGTHVVLWSCDGSAAQRWTYVPDALPDSNGTLTINGKCLDIIGHGTSNGTRLQLWTCTGAPNQAWSLQYGAAWLWNPASGRCMDDPGASTENGTEPDIADCISDFPQQFTLPPGPVLSAVAGQCVADPGNSTRVGTVIGVARCDGGGAQLWDAFSNPGSVTTHGSNCLAVASVPGAIAFLDGTPLKLEPCANTSLSSYNSWLWFPLPNGEIINGISGTCLASQGNGGEPGAAGLVIEDCYGQPGEIWAAG